MGASDHANSFKHDGDNTTTAVDILVARDVVDKQSLKDREDIISGDVMQRGFGSVFAKNVMVTCRACRQIGLCVTDALGVGVWLAPYERDTAQIGSKHSRW